MCAFSVGVISSEQTDQGSSTTTEASTEPPVAADGTETIDISDDVTQAEAPSVIPGVNSQTLAQTAGEFPSLLRSLHNIHASEELR